MSPLQFATEILNINVWPKLAEIFEAVAPSDGSPGERKVLVRSCNGGRYARRHCKGAIKKSENNFEFSCIWCLDVLYCRDFDGHPILIKNEELRINSGVRGSFIENRDKFFP